MVYRRVPSPTTPRRLTPFWPWRELANGVDLASHRCAEDISVCDRDGNPGSPPRARWLFEYRSVA